MGFYENGNESTGYVKCGNFLDPFMNCWLFKKESEVMEFIYLFVI